MWLHGKLIELTRPSTGSGQLDDVNLRFEIVEPPINNSSAENQDCCFSSVSANLLSNDTARQCCLGCHPPGCLCSGRRYHPPSPLRCSSESCHEVAARSSPRPPRTVHSRNRWSQTGMRDLHWRVEPWYSTGSHSAGLD